jgi:hypothetical protein
VVGEVQRWQVHVKWKASERCFWRICVGSRGEVSDIGLVNWILEELGRRT